MVWVTLHSIGIEPEKGLGTHGIISASKVSALKFFQPACLCLVPFKMLKKFGLGEPFGKASLANTVLGLGRFISMREKSFGTGKGWSRYPSEAWPDEVLKRGLPKPSSLPSSEIFIEFDLSQGKSLDKGLMFS